MKSFKRGIAVLLAALLLIPNMPAKAEEESSGGLRGPRRYSITPAAASIP